jgi:hypothetical protein
LFGSWWVGTIDVGFELAEELEGGRVEAAFLFAVPEQGVEFPVWLEGVDAKLVFLAGEGVIGIVRIGVTGLAGVLQRGVVGLGAASAGDGGGWAVQGAVIEASLEDDEDEVGVSAGAGEGVAAPVFEGVLGVEDGVALVAVEREVGDVAIFRFDEDGLGGSEDLGEGGLLFGEGVRRNEKEKREQAEAGQGAIQDGEHDGGMVHLVGTECTPTHDGGTIIDGAHRVAEKAEEEKGLRR